MNEFVAKFYHEADCPESERPTLLEASTLELLIKKAGPICREVICLAELLDRRGHGEKLCGLLDTTGRFYPRLGVA